MLKDFHHIRLIVGFSELPAVIYEEYPYDREFLDSLDNSVESLFCEPPLSGVLFQCQFCFAVGASLRSFLRPIMAAMHTGCLMSFCPVKTVVRYYMGKTPLLLFWSEAFHLPCEGFHPLFKFCSRSHFSQRQKAVRCRSPPALFPPELTPFRWI